MRAAFLGDDRAQAHTDPRRGPAERASSSLSEIPFPSGPAARNRTFAADSPLSSRLALSAILLVTLIWALILGQAMAGESLAGREATRRPVDPDVVARPIGKGFSTSLARLAKIRPGHRTGVVTHFPRPRLDDPSDDETSDDPSDDDDNWEGISAVKDSDDQVIVWFPDCVRYHLIASELSPALAWTETPSTPFLPQQRLRC
jgi:hypothetical protein